MNVGNYDKKNNSFQNKLTATSRIEIKFLIHLCLVSFLHKLNFFLERKIKIYNLHYNEYNISKI